MLKILESNFNCNIPRYVDNNGTKDPIKLSILINSFLTSVSTGGRANKRHHAGFRGKVVIRKRTNT